MRTGCCSNSNAIAGCSLGITELSEIVYEQRSSLKAFQAADLDTGARSPIPTEPCLVRDTFASERVAIPYFIAFDSTRGNHWYLDLKDWYIPI